MMPLARLLRPSTTSVAAARAALARGEDFALEYPRLAAWFAEGGDTAVERHIAQLRTLGDVFVQGHADLLAARLQVLRAAQAGDAAALTAASLHLAQCAPPPLTELEQLLQHPTTAEVRRGFRHPVRHNATTLQEKIVRRLARRGFTNMTVRLSTRPRLRVTLKADGTGSIRIPTSLQLTRRRVKRMLAHEIDIHVARAFNARQNGNPSLLLSTLGSKMTEEGLAMWHQDTVAKPARLPSGFWDAYAVALVREHGVQAAYTELCRHKSARRAARLVLRCLRGFSTIGPLGTGYFFDHLYLVGAQKIRDLTDEERARLMKGRFGMELLPQVF
jgi:hypothetical protein